MRITTKPLNGTLSNYRTEFHVSYAIYFYKLYRFYNQPTYNGWQMYE